MSNPSKAKVFLAWLVLALVALAAYANTFHVPFYFDDREAITDNPSIEHLSWSALNPPSEHCAGVIGRPLVNFSLAINYYFSERREISYHVMNLCFHVLAAWLLLAVLWRTLQLPPLAERFGEAAFPLAFFTTLTWTLHPLVTETVTNAIQRDESMVAIFYLLAFYCFIRSIKSSREIAWQAGAVVACVVGMAAKEVMFTAPLLILLYDRTFVGGTFRAAWEKRKMFYAALASSWVGLAALLLMDGQRGDVEGQRVIIFVWMLFLVAWVRWRPGYVIATSGLAVLVGLTLGANQRGNTVGFGLGMSPWTYALKQCDALMDYFRLSFWPRPLILDYGTDVVQHLSDVWPQALVIIALLAATAYALARKPVLGFIGAWVFVILAPSSSFLPLTTQTEAEHRMYLPLAAIATLAVLALYTWAGRRSYVVWGLLAIALGSATHARNDEYRTETSMWTATVRDRPDNPRAHYDLGCALLDSNHQRAAVQFIQAIELDPNYTDAHCNLGLCYSRSGNSDRAIDEYWTATWIDPDDVQSQFNLGCAYDEIGELSSALGRYRTAVKLDPSYTEAQAAVGSVLLRLNEPSAAIISLKAALADEPNNLDVLMNYGEALSLQGKTPEAIDVFTQVVGWDPDNADAHKKLAVVLADAGLIVRALEEDSAVLRLQPSGSTTHYVFANHYAKTTNLEPAIAEYNQALQLRPNYLQAENALGAALNRLGRTEDARAAYLRALAVNPDYADAHCNLGILLLENGELADAESHLRRALSIDPNYAEAHAELGAVLIKENRNPEALLQIQEALRLNSKNQNARQNLEAVQAAMGTEEK